MLPRFALLLIALLTPFACIPDTDARGCLETCELRLEAEQCAVEVDACFERCDLSEDGANSGDIECAQRCVLDDLITCIAAEANEGAAELISCAAACVGEVEDSF